MAGHQDTDCTGPRSYKSARVPDAYVDAAALHVPCKRRKRLARCSAAPAATLSIGGGVAIWAPQRLGEGEIREDAGHAVVAPPCRAAQHNDVAAARAGGGVQMQLGLGCAMQCQHAQDQPWQLPAVGGWSNQKLAQASAAGRPAAAAPAAPTCAAAAAWARRPWWTLPSGTRHRSPATGRPGGGPGTAPRRRRGR